MSDTPKKDTPKQKYILDKYDDRIKVGANEFYKDGKGFKEGNILERDLSVNMMRIYNIVSTTAIDRLNEKKFIEFYNDKDLLEFHGARLTRMYPPCTVLDSNNLKNDIKTVGFLFAAYYSKKDKDTGEYFYIGKAFPGIKFEERIKEVNRAEWNRQDFYKMFLGFYLDQIFIVLEKEIKRETGNDKYYNENIKPLQDRIDNYDITETPPTNEQYQKDIKRVIKYLHIKKISVEGKQIKLPDMQIDAFAENPISYKDFCEFGFNYNVKPPSEEFKEWSKNWSVADLLHLSYVESRNPNPPSFLSDVEFTVNLTPREWRKYFEIAIDKNFVPMKYYLWQNYNFPDKAFTAIQLVNIFIQFEYSFKV
ncbi:MAG TPA: hypothetical protein VFI29_12655 [Hanamia sp.]|nr:hypothetical protein [Hanamia sp.]